MTPEEFEKNRRGINYKNAWAYFYPEGNGKPLKGYNLHHKDPTLKYRDPVRYLEWRPEDLELLTASEHTKLHAKLRENDLEYKNKLSKGMKNAWNNPAIRDKIVASQIIAQNDPEFRARLNEKIRLANTTPEVKEKHSRASKRKWADPEYAEKTRAAIREKNKSSEFRNKISEALKGKPFTEEHKAKIREAALKRWSKITKENRTLSVDHTKESPGPEWLQGRK